MVALPALDNRTFTLRLLERVDKRAARDSLQTFTARMVQGYDAAPHITDALIPALERTVNTPGGRLIVTMPPRHSKSLHVSENLPAWYLGTHPDERIIAASHTAGLAYTFSRRVRNKIADPRYPFAVTVADDKGAVSAWDTDAGGGYLAVGAGGAPTGHGGNGIIIDDPIRSAADADSQTARDNLWEWYQGTIRTRLEPGGWIICTATRWSQDDLTGRLLAAADAGGEQWDHLHLPAISDDGAPLWPSRWPLDALTSIRVAVGSRQWEAQYQGRPSPAEGGLVKRHWWRFWQRDGDDLPPVLTQDAAGRAVAHAVVTLPALCDRAALSWDMAFKKTEDGSYVVGLAGQTWGPNVYVTDRYRARASFGDSITAILAMRAAHPHITTTLVEDAANGPAVIDTLRQHVPGILPVRPDGSKEARLTAITPLIEAGNVILPHPRIAPWVDEFIDELAAFPNGAADDQCDAASQLVRYLMPAGMNTDAAALIDALFRAPFTER